MKFGPECYICIYRQVYNLTKKLAIGEWEQGELMREVAQILGKVEMDKTPPEVAGKIYPFLEKKTGITDPFKTEKEHSIALARKLKPQLAEVVKRSKDPLKTALKLSALGNVLDFGALVEVDLEKEIRELNSLPFARWDYSLLLQELKKGGELFLIGDNAGENVLDEILVEVVLNKTPISKVYYGVRGKAIINDLTVKEVVGTPMAQMAEIIDTGVPLPGFHLEHSSKRATELFYRAKVVIGKGMGNYETLTEIKDRKIFFLLKIKCKRVARATNSPEGKYLLMGYNF